MILALGLAFAELPLPDYRQAVTEAAGAEVARIARDTSPTEAEDFARRWMRAVGESARVQYEMGLAWRLAGDDARRGRVPGDRRRRRPRVRPGRGRGLVLGRRARERHDRTLAGAGAFRDAKRTLPTTAT